MPLLDNKYEIISQRDLSAEQTLFDATAPDGTTLSIIWYNIGDAKVEQQFERYRRLLKALKRNGHAALFDVVSRPGAHYVAWYKPEGKLKQGLPDEVKPLLHKYGYQHQQASWQANEKGPILYHLSFGAIQGKLPEMTEAVRSKRHSRLPRIDSLPVWLWGWLLATPLFLLAGWFFYASFRLQTNDRLIAIPDVRGRPVQLAADRLFDLGFEVQVEAEASPEQPGMVIGSFPEQGVAQRPGRRVRLTYALPPGQAEPTTVPQLRGLQVLRGPSDTALVDNGERNQDDVRTRLRESGLKLGRIATIPASVPAGLVLSQSQAAESQVGRGTEIELLVSQGPFKEMTFLPDLVGLSVEDALFFARLAGLERVEQEVLETTPGQAGLVLAQSISPFISVPKDDVTLRLTVAGESGVKLEEDMVPNLIGLSLEDARRLSNGFDVRSDVMTDLALPEGVVMQTPEPGSVATEVGLELTVNIHPKPVPIPSVNVALKPPRLRELPFTFIIEQGIGTQRAEVYSQMLDGEETLVATFRGAKGGDRLQGTWLTNKPGPFRFILRLNGALYQQSGLINP